MARKKEKKRKRKVLDASSDFKPLLNIVCGSFVSKLSEKRKRVLVSLPFGRYTNSFVLNLYSL